LKIKEIWDFLFYGDLSEFMGFWRTCGQKMVKNFGGFGIPLGKYKIKRKLYIYQFEIKNLIILFSNRRT